METRARHILGVIRQCVRAGRYLVLPHFVERMDLRGLFWPDVQSVLDSAASVEDGGPDDQGRAKWIITGEATDGMILSVVCALDFDSRGRVTVFITAYWDKD